MRVGVVGSAGRDGTYTPVLFARMEACLRTFLSQFTGVTLVSGGAAGADHLVVRLSENYPGIIYGPCAWTGTRYEDNGSPDWRVNPGRLANRYHEQFARTTGIPSLAELQAAIDSGRVKYIPGSGFHQRNGFIAACDVLIAFTFSPGPAPTSGGSADTWKKCSGVKFHVSLSRGD